MSLYTFAPSAPCRSVEMLLNHMNISHKLETLDLFKGEQHNEEFLKINPQHCAPTWKDDKVTLWESRAIMKYLVLEHGGDNNSLYPKNDDILCAKIDHALYFDMGTLFM